MNENKDSVNKLLSSINGVSLVGVPSALAVDVMSAVEDYEFLKSYLK